MSNNHAAPKKLPPPPLSQISGSAGSPRRPATRGLSGTPISARAAAKKSISSSSPMALSSSAVYDQDPAMQHHELSSVMAELREKLEQAEASLQEMRRHNEALQARFDDATKDQAEMEEKLHEEEEKREELENEKREIVKQKRELENIYEAERAAVIKDKDATNGREEELQNIIQRLKDSMSQKDGVARGGIDTDAARSGEHANAPSPVLGANQFAPSLNRSNSFRNNSKLLLQKDKVIEELRLELAEYQIKLMELDNKDGDRTQGLEKALMEARVTNARLMEENESFQSLLMERTLNGEFTHKRISDPSTMPSNVSDGGTTLADELAGMSDDEPEQYSDKLRRLEIEIERQKAENKTLTLYINKIIERILKHKGGFENILNTADDEEASALGSLAGARKDKDLPSPPPKDEQKDQDEPQGFLQRARSIAYSAGRRPRPQSVIAPPRTTPPTVNEDPDTAPRIPLGRAQQNRHSMALPRRTQTSADYMSGAAAVVNNMYKGEQDNVVRNISPGMGSPRPSSYFLNRMPSGPRTATTSQAASESERRMSSSAASEEDSEAARKRALDALNGDSTAEPSTSTPTDTPSPPRSIGGASNKDDGKQAAPQVLSGRQIRPLRLVAEEQKKTNRQTWIPTTVTSTVSNWFNKEGTATTQGQTPRSHPVATTTNTS